MIRALSLSAILMLSACAAAPVTGQPAPGAGEVVATERDCAVIAAVAREHYRYDRQTPLPLQVVVEANGQPPFRLACEWSRWGLSFPRTFQPEQASTPGKPVQWVRFERPVYDSDGATVETGYLVGPLAGAGKSCRLRSGVAGWTVVECRDTWIS